MFIINLSSLSCFKVKNMLFNQEEVESNWFKEFFFFFVEIIDFLRFYFFIEGIWNEMVNKKFKEKILFGKKFFINNSFYFEIMIYERKHLNLQNFIIFF